MVPTAALVDCVRLRAVLRFKTIVFAANTGTVNTWGPTLCDSSDDSRHEDRDFEAKGQYQSVPSAKGQ